ncbi:hypothetical protein DXD72_01110 [Bifidobacterium bifidum]|uniref:hypothetical protein n=1 Tax=Bifidobacterium bifidum TaxID=1681 RepID=UPI000E436A1B|nr:hypothetical protein [Bifidobacterium bifidum]RGJ16961.1 hypothetical protein DXD72_01110 [Bifidobacterium bifidum]RGJ75605.1 hypothetical protein DXD45_01110 [Bifidobacterium bifidum]RGK04791.1 hypothetical protein DXD34_05030 [Bifidobacterium bifidum]RGL70279.1 hypothetical protein DXC50_01110 [Bifidobacterium bifidum]RHC37024.1 hypothetical protein DW845_00330 [Bifidobacterium bifidum]
MAFQLDATAIAHVSMNPAVRDAAAVGAGLIELWPLTDAKQMDNDTKYGENLQVRMTRMAARVMTGDDVTVPDAEFVYEGADEIPGRPQRIVDALLAANDAYDEMGDYSETGDTRLIMRGAGQLGVDWDDDTVHAIAEALEAIEQAIGAADGAADGAAGGAAAPANAAPSADVEAIAQRFATVTVAADGLLRLIDLRKPSRAVPVMFYVNELCERLSVPRLCFKAEQLSSLMTARSLTNDDEAVLAETVKLFTMVAASEWKRHHDDVLWDAAEAKRLAKEEDERRNKEALAAKFAHVGDDPSKPPVEL